MVLPGIVQLVYRRTMGWTARAGFLAGARFFSSPKRSDRLCGPPSLLSSGCQGDISLDAKQSQREADLSPPFIVKFKMMELRRKISPFVLLIRY
jgi:hypothetical protein